MILLPVVLSVAAVGAFVYHARTSPHGKILSAIEPHLPEKLRSAVAYSIQQGTDPKKMVELAKKLQPSAPVAAAMVATRAKQIAKPSPVALVKPPPAPAAPTFNRVPSPVENVQIVYDDEVDRAAARRDF